MLWKSILPIHPNSLRRNRGSRAGREGARENTMLLLLQAAWKQDGRAPCRALLPHNSELELHLRLKHSDYIQGWWSQTLSSLINVLETFRYYPEPRKVGMLTFVPCICILSFQWAYTAAGTHKHYQPLHGIFQVPSSTGLSAKLALHTGYKCPDIEASWKPGKLWQTDMQCLGK